MPLIDKKAVKLPDEWKTIILKFIEENGVKHVFIATKLRTGRTQMSQIFSGHRKVNFFEQQQLMKLIPGLPKIILPEPESELQD